jgi:tetratricopeptide (TPR) repeat protein
MTAMSRSRRPRFFWLLLCLLALLELNPASNGDTYAFLVGISEYESKDELKALRFACDDVISFAGVLRNSGVPAKNIVVLHDRQSIPRFKPVGKKILKEFHLLLATLEPEDFLIVALAGHGVQIGPAGENYFLPADADLKDPATLINIKTIYREMEKSQVGRKLLLVDACRNDPEADNARRVGVSLQPPRGMAEGPLAKGIAALFSCNSEQRSFEDPVLRHGIFFYQVIKAWEGAADLDRDGKLTLDELEGFVRRETKTHARDALSSIQTPVFQADRSAAGRWVVASLAAQRPEPGGADAADLLDRADALRRQGDDAAAEREYAKALRTDPNSAQAHLGLARLHHARGRLPQALKEYSEAIKTDPNNALAFVGRAIALGDGGDLKAALADYEQAARINPDLVVTHVGQGAILTRMNRWDEAIAACTRAIALDAKNAKAYFNRGVAREAKKDEAGAARDFRKAFELDPRLKAP